MKSSDRIDRTGSSIHRRIPPGPRGNWLLGSMPDFLDDSLGYLRRMAQDYGDVVRYRVAHMTWYQVNHPDGIARILQENNRNYSKGALTLGILRPVAGDGLFLSHEERYQASVEFTRIWRRVLEIRGWTRASLRTNLRPSCN